MSELDELYLESLTNTNNNVTFYAAASSTNALEFLFTYYSYYNGSDEDLEWYPITYSANIYKVLDKNGDPITSNTGFYIYYSLFACTTLALTVELYCVHGVILPTFVYNNLLYMVIPVESSGLAIYIGFNNYKIVEASNSLTYCYQSNSSATYPYGKFVNGGYHDFDETDIAAAGTIMLDPSDNSILIGSRIVKGCYVGSLIIEKIYVGNTLMYDWRFS